MKKANSSKSALYPSKAAVDAAQEPLPPSPRTMHRLNSVGHSMSKNSAPGVVLQSNTVPSGNTFLTMVMNSPRSQQASTAAAQPPPTAKVTAAKEPTIQKTTPGSMSKLKEEQKSVEVDFEEDGMRVEEHDDDDDGVLNCESSSEEAVEDRTVAERENLIDEMKAAYRMTRGEVVELLDQHEELKRKEKAEKKRRKIEKRNQKALQDAQANALQRMAIEGGLPKELSAKVHAGHLKQNTTVLSTDEEDKRRVVNQEDGLVAPTLKSQREQEEELATRRKTSQYFSAKKSGDVNEEGIVMVQQETKEERMNKALEEIFPSHQKATSTHTGYEDWCSTIEFDDPKTDAEYRRYLSCQHKEQVALKDPKKDYKEVTVTGNIREEPIVVPVLFVENKFQKQFSRDQKRKKEEEARKIEEDKVHAEEAKKRRIIRGMEVNQAISQRREQEKVQREEKLKSAGGRAGLQLLRAPRVTK